MESLFAKTRLALLSNLHGLLNAAIDLNSIGAIEQRVRDLEAGRDSMRDQRAVIRADMNALQAEVGKLKADYAAADENINIVLTDDDLTNDHLAEKFQKQMLLLEQQIADKVALSNSNQEDLTKLDDALSKIDAALSEMQGRLRSLRTLKATATGKERVAAALKGINLGDSSAIDNVEARLRRKAGVADARLDDQLGQLGEAVGGSMMDVTAAALIAKRKQALAAKAAETATSATGTQG